MRGDPGTRIGDLYPVFVATAVSLVLYYQQASLLLLKVGEVFSGVFDTSVPAYPLVGMLFVLMFMLMRRREFALRLADRKREPGLVISGLALVVIPLSGLLFSGSSLSGSYVYAAMALTTSWVGAVVAVRPSLFRFLWPYLLIYLAAIGSVSVLTTVFGDPLAVVVAGVSNGMTSLLGLPVRWSSVYITFTAAGGSPVDLYISQECSGIASISIFLLFVGLMHLDLKPRTETSVFIGVGGSLLFVFLNAARVVTLIAGGIFGGTELLWSLHGWVGYAFYVFGYSLLLIVYAGQVHKANGKSLSKQA